eukprot:2008966-Ditylum_brightwellii.AAC.1
MFLLHSDRKRYGSLVVDLTNAHTRGKDKYPTTMTDTYKYLVDFQSPTVINNTPDKWVWHSTLMDQDGVAEVVKVKDQDVAVEEAEVEMMAVVVPEEGVIKAIQMVAVGPDSQSRTKQI